MRVTTCVFGSTKPVHLAKVAERRPQLLRAGILNKSCPKQIQTVHVSIMTELHFTVRVKRSGRLSEEGSAMTRTARRPARCAVP